MQDCEESGVAVELDTHKGTWLVFKELLHNHAM